MSMSMEEIITWAKGNYDLISLGVGVLGVLIGVVSLRRASRTWRLSYKHAKSNTNTTETNS